MHRIPLLLVPSLAELPQELKHPWCFLWRCIAFGVSTGQICSQELTPSRGLHCFWSLHWLNCLKSRSTFGVSCGGVMPLVSPQAEFAHRSRHPQDAYIAFFLFSLNCL